MDAATAIANLMKLQQIFRLFTALQITNHFFPPPACVKDDAKYDFIIVGGGTAGCVIASALAEYNVSVLLVEAGGIPPFETIYPAYFTYPKFTTVDWNITSTRDRTKKYRKKDIPDITQGKILGGSSSLSYMLYSRGNPRDYDNWATITNDSSWSYDSISPLFIKSEGVIDKEILNSPKDRALRGTKGKIQLTKYYYDIKDKYISAYKELGIKIVVDINERNPVGATTTLFAAGKERRSSTAYAYLRTVKPILDILTDALVTKILFNRNTAVGVKICLKNTREIIIKANKEVIITAGVFKSPQLLMISGIGPKEQLKAKNIQIIRDLPVGKNLHERQLCCVHYKMDKARPSRGPVIPYTVGIPSADAYIAMNKSQDYPDFQVVKLLFDDVEKFLSICAFLLTFTNKICDNIARNAVGRQIFVAFIILSNPKSRGQVFLNTTNMEDQPIINLGYYTNDADVETYAKSVIHFNAILNTTYFKSVDAEFIDPEVKTCARFKKDSMEYWRCYVVNMVSTAHYYVGTCAMGQVVDSKLLVKGVKNLRVADASIMPQTVSSPPLATVIMIAQKAVDIIVKHYTLNK